MATNNIKPFAIGNGANVTSQVDYEALAALLTGFQSGKASSAQINKALRQSSFVASVLAQFISDKAGVDVLDNGDAAVLLTSLIAALKANSANDFLQKSNNLADVADKTISLGNLGGAPLLSPTFTGIPKGPTAAAGTNNTQFATTAFAQALIAGLLKTSNNLSEIAAAGPAAVTATLANLGLGEAAKRGVGTGQNQVPDMSSFVQTLAAQTGFKSLPGGVKIQYGQFSIASGGAASTTVTFPEAFLNTCVFVVPVPYSAADQQMGIKSGSMSATSAIIMKGNSDGSSRSGLYLAFGY